MRARRSFSGADGVESGYQPLVETREPQQRMTGLATIIKIARRHADGPERLLAEPGHLPPVQPTSDRLLDY